MLIHDLSSKLSPKLEIQLQTLVSNELNFVTFLWFWGLKCIYYIAPLVIVRSDVCECLSEISYCIIICADVGAVDLGLAILIWKLRYPFVTSREGTRLEFLGVKNGRVVLGPNRVRNSIAVTKRWQLTSIYRLRALEWGWRQGTHFAFFSIYFKLYLIGGVPILIPNPKNLVSKI